MNNFQIPTQLIKMLKNGNPQQIAMNMLQQNSNGNPMIENVINMANNNNSAGIETIARNLCKSRGIDADEMMNAIKKQWQ